MSKLKEKERNHRVTRLKAKENIDYNRQGGKRMKRMIIADKVERVRKE